MKSRGNIPITNSNFWKLRKCQFILIFILDCLIVTAQNKRIIDTSSLDKWPCLNRSGISSNGKFVYYTTTNWNSGKEILYIKDIQKKSSLIDTIEAGADISFSEKSNYLIYKKEQEVNIVKLLDFSFKKITGVEFFSIPETNDVTCFTYSKNNDPNTIFIENLNTDKLQKYDNCNRLQWAGSGNKYFVFRNNNHELRMLDGTTMIDKLVYKDSLDKITIAKIDRSCRNVLAVVSGNKISRMKLISLSQFSTRELYEVKNEKNFIADAYFSQNDKYVFFSLGKTTSEVKQKKTAFSVNIWNYHDTDLQPNQQVELERNIPQNSYFSTSLSTGQTVQIASDSDEILTPLEEISGNYIVISPKYNSFYWVRSYRPYYLLCIDNGEKKLLNEKNEDWRSFDFAPHDRFLVIFDSKLKSYLNLNLKTFVYNNPCATMNVPLTVEDAFAARNINPVDQIACWSTTGEYMYIYDRNDIWKINLLNLSAPINITGGYGKRNHIKFRIIKESVDNLIPVIRDRQSLLLTAFQTDNKWNGFYSLSLGKRNILDSIILQPFVYYRTDSQKPHFFSFQQERKPIKAKYNNTWLVVRSSYNDPQNCYVTTDFRNFVRISDIEPQKEYKWFNAQLLNYKAIDESSSMQAIMYTPQDLDSSKKYPVIINYYRQLTHRLYEFPYPEKIMTNLNIPWFVSHDYIVINPDIYFSENNTQLHDAYKSIASLMHELTKIKFIDLGHIGIQGHSWGGTETNYLITKIKFAAAAEMAGQSDPISSFLTLVPFVNKVEHYERSSIDEDEFGAGANLWIRPELYMEESAVLNANKISTPLLITHNTNDNQISWHQGVEMYMALRRLQKPVWLLQYDNGNHGIYNDDAMDYTIRLTQFFDHYLKGAPAPVWMTKGIPAKLKGFESGYELDLGVEP